MYNPGRQAAAPGAAHREAMARARSQRPRARDEDEGFTSRLARVSGHSVEFVSALAAPIFDYRGDLVLSLVLFGFKSSFDISWNGRNAELLRTAAGEISAKLGYLSDSA